MEGWESLFKGKPIQELRSTLETLRQAGATRIKRVRRLQRWFVRGAIVGAVWAVLYAPQPGAETRQALGRLLHPLAEIGASLLTWLRNQQRASLDQATARRTPGRTEHTTKGWPSNQSGAETSGAEATHEDAASLFSRSS